jgi:hypothetical protein
MQKTFKNSALLWAVGFATFVSGPKGALASDFKADAYGFLRTEVIGSSGALDSFGYNNFTAFTAAANPLLAKDPSKASGSFQVGQSRVGLHLLNETARIEARLEADFVDFTKASPTTKANPRLRRAVVEYVPSDGWLLRFGQDWSMFSPNNPLTYNPVGNYFQAGNVGFMRIQAAAMRKTGSLEHAIAISLPAANNGTTNVTTEEIGFVPALEARETVTLSDRWTVGLSGIASTLPKASSDGRFFAGGLDLNTTWQDKSSGTELRAAAYYGRNVVNLGLLGLGNGDGTANNPSEVGGYLTAKQSVSETVAFFGGLGGAWVTDETQVQTNYYSAAYAYTGAGTGFLSNVTARLGIEYKPVSVLAFYGEAGWLDSRYRYAAADVGKYDPTRQAFVLDIGTQLNF